MIHASRLAALALAVAVGSVALAEDTSGKAANSGATGAAASSADTEIKGVYSTKRMMGISTGASSDTSVQDAAEKSGAEGKSRDEAAD